MPKCSDFKSPLRKLKEDFLGKHSSSPTSSTPIANLECDNMFAESFVHNDNQLRRPMNAFLLFCKRHRQVVRTRHPWLDNRACTKMLADMWGALDGEEKDKYLQLARECKAAFMKAHPGYRWSGPHKHSGKVTNPGSITTRPHISGTDESKAGITIGKLADPSQMGGLSLLLLAGQQEAGNKRLVPSYDQHKTMHRSSSEPESNEREEDDESIKSKLFQFAEMCSDQLSINHESNSEASDDMNLNHHKHADITLDHKAMDTFNINNNTIPLNSVMHVSITSHKTTSEKSNASTNDRTDVKDENKTLQMGLRNKDEEVEKEEGMTKIKMNNKKRKEELINIHMKRKIEKSSKKKKKKKKKIVKMTECSEALSVSWPGAFKGVIKQEKERKDQGNDKEEEKEKAASLNNSEGPKTTGQRKSRRSCKGQLYRKLVDQGMLESLQRPERPFNCKKAWRHSNEGMSGFSDAEDEVFQPEDGKKGRRARKRTISGSNLTCSDFDYGEINVEARLATLPQYAPEQFRTNKKAGLKCTKTSDIYKNAKFIEERGKSKVMRSLSSTEITHSVTGSQKRKARKSSIMHLLPAKDAVSITTSIQSSTSTHKDETVIRSKVKRSMSDPQPFTLSDLADVASMELKPCSSASTTCTSGSHVDGPSLCFSAVTVS